MTAKAEETQAEEQETQTVRFTLERRVMQTVEYEAELPEDVAPDEYAQQICDIINCDTIVDRDKDKRWCGMTLALKEVDDVPDPDDRQLESCDIGEEIDDFEVYSVDY